MKFNSIFKTMFYGLCLGISLLPPGFSAATMAMILGIYEDLIGLLNDLFSTKMKQTVKVLIFLLLGAVAAIAVFSKIISTGMDKFPYQTRFLFLGLIVATVPLIYKQAEVKVNFTLKHCIFLIIAFLIAASFAFGGSFALVDLDGDMSALKVLYLMFAGALVSSSMILPGLSGALMLILIGAYQYLLESVNTFDVIVLSCVGIGAVIGLIICGRLIKRLLERGVTTLYAISLGLVIGSIPVVLSEGVPTGVFDILAALIFSVIGVVIVMLLNAKRI